MKHVFYNMWSAHDEGVDEHPQTQLKKLGIKYYKSVPQSLFDGWEFWIDDDAELPDYIKELSRD